MIIECNGRTTEEKLKSLQESVQRALNDAGSGGSSSSLGTIYIGVNGKIQGVIDGKYVNIKNLNANNITTGDLNAQRIQAAFVDAQGGKIIDFETESINGHHILDGSVVADALDNAVVTLFTDTSVYYSGEEPTGTADKPLKNGDLWYKSVDTDVDRAKYFYVYDEENEEWVEKTLDASMFTANTITAREIASGTITASELAANTISADKLTIGLNNTIDTAKDYSIPEYAPSESNVTAPEEGWSTNMPTLSEANPYLWQRISVFTKVTGGNDTYKSSTTPELVSTTNELFKFKYEAANGVQNVINGSAIAQNTIDINQLNVSSRNTITNKAEQSALNNEIDARAAITDLLNDTVADQSSNLTSINGKVQIDQGGGTNVNIRTGSSYIGVSNGRISFMDNGNEVAYMDSNGLQVLNEYVTYMFPRVKNNQTGMLVGSLGWIARTNGHLTLKKVRGGI